MRLGTVADVAAALRCSRSTVERLEKAGELPVPRIRVGNLLRYDLDVLEQELARLRLRQVREALRLVGK